MKNDFQDVESRIRFAMKRCCSFLMIVSAVLCGAVMFSFGEEQGGGSDSVSDAEGLRQWMEEHDETGGTVTLENSITFTMREKIVWDPLAPVVIDCGDYGLRLEKAEDYSWADEMRIGENVTISGSGLGTGSDSESDSGLDTGSELDTGSGAQSVLYLGDETYVTFSGHIQADGRIGLYLEEDAEIEGYPYGSIDVSGPDGIGVYVDAAQSGSKTLLKGLKISAGNESGICVWTNNDLTLMNCVLESGSQTPVTLVDESELTLDTSIMRKLPEGTLHSSGAGTVIDHRFIRNYITGVDISFDDQEEMVAAKGTEFSSLPLPGMLEASLENSDGDLEYVYLSIEWHQGNYDGGTAGVYEITGEWKLMDEELPIDVSTYPLRVTVRVMEKRLPVLREPAVKLAEDTYQILPEMKFYGAKRYILWESIDGGPFVESQQRVLGESLDNPVIYLRNLEQDRIYRYRLEVIGGVCEGESNVVEIRPGGGEVEENPSDGDGSSGGKRGGGTRDTQDSKTSKYISAKQSALLLDTGAESQLFIVDGIKLFIPKAVFSGISGNGTRDLEIDAERSGALNFDLTIRSSGNTLRAYGGKITLYVPFVPSDAGWSSSKTDAATFVSKVGGKLIKDGYYDAKIGAMVIPVESGGSFEIVKQNPWAKMKDCSGHWGTESIAFLVSRGIAAGYGDGTFAPDRKTSAGEFARLLSGVCGSSGGKNFTDTNQLTRSEAALMIYNAMGTGSSSGGGSAVSGSAGASSAKNGSGGQPANGAYNDLKGVTAKEKTAIAFVTNAGIMKGKGGGIFDPKGKLTRAESSVIIRNIMMK